MKHQFIGIVIGILLISCTTSLALTPFSTDEQRLKHQFFDTAPTPLLLSNVWMKTFGGTGADYGYSVQQTTDGGYIITGKTNSFGGGMNDVWLIKTDGNGDKVWDKTFGGYLNDGGSSVQQTTDGGYIITGFTESYDVNNIDTLVIKTDSNGEQVWKKIFGGNSDDYGNSVQQTNDGGYIITGSTASFGISGTGSSDVWLIKTTSNGYILWIKHIDGPASETGNSIQQTTDGGYIITGYTYSKEADTKDVYLTKTDGKGDKVWDKIFGGTEYDSGCSVQQTTDGGFIITGFTESYGAGMNDIWLIKTTSNGDMVWNRTFGGLDDDEGYFVQQTTDGGFIIAGSSGSFGAGSSDVWLIKTDGNGDKLWDKTFGGVDGDYAWSVQQTTDNGYIITGMTLSFGAGGADVWLIKTDENGDINNPPNTPTITGEINGAIQTSYDYTIQTTDPDQNDVQYRIDWGDNTTTITDLYESGANVIVSHTWNTEGTYNVKVKAIDEYYKESDWATLTVTMPSLYNKPILSFLESLFQRFPNAFRLQRQLIGY